MGWSDTADGDVIDASALTEGMTLYAIWASRDELIASLEKATEEFETNDNALKELAEKNSELQIFIIIVCVISCVTLGGGGAFVIWFFIDRKKKL